MASIREFVPMLGVLVRLGLIAIALGALWFGARSADPRASLRVNVVLILVAVFSLGVWLNPGDINRSRTFAQMPNMFHYYLGSKYFHEIGYFNLYGAALAADAEILPGYFFKVRFARDLRNYEVVRSEQLRENSDFVAKFTPERWAAFKSDLAFIQRGREPSQWVKPLLDHGNNAPPSQAFVSGVLANLLGPANLTSLTFLALLDPLLMAVLLISIGRIYDLRTAALAAIFFGMNELCEFGYIAGSFLRLDWLVAAGLGICSLRVRRHLLAGFLFGVATMLRVFPAMFVAAVLLRGAIEFARTGTWPTLHRRFAIGLILGSVPLFVASFGLNFDPQGWIDFFEKIRLHHGVVAINIIGLRLILDDGSLLFWLMRGILVLLFVSSISRVEEDSQAAILGGTLIFAVLTIADYYYGLLLLFVLWQPWKQVDMRAMILIALLFFSASIVIVALRAMNVSLDVHFRISTLCLLATFVVLFAQIHLAAKPEKTRRDRISP